MQLLGFKVGVFHVELKATSRGPRLIEVNARMGGGGVRCRTTQPLALMCALANHSDYSSYAKSMHSLCVYKHGMPVYTLHCLITQAARLVLTGILMHAAVPAGTSTELFGVWIW